MFEETLQSEEYCLEEFDESNDDDELRPPYDEEADDDDAEDDEPTPRFIEYRCSPVCRFLPTVRMLIERHSKQINELLNVLGGALSERVHVNAEYPPYAFTSRRDRIYYGRYLTAPGELEAVYDELRAENERLRADLLGATGEAPRAEFMRVEHHLRDYRILVALAGCHRDNVFYWWDTALIRLQQGALLRQFYRARDAMRARDPEERKAARARDAKRRKTRHRKEYLAQFEARPDVRAKRAERKRAARAAARLGEGGRGRLEETPNGACLVIANPKSADVGRLKDDPREDSAHAA